TADANHIGFTITLNSNQTVTSGNPGANLFFDGAIDTNGKELTFAGNGLAQLLAAISGAGGLVKTGAGSASLYASNSFSAPVQINQGALLVYHSRALGTTNGSTTLANGAQLGLAGPISVPETLVLS